MILKTGTSMSSVNIAFIVYTLAMYNVASWRGPKAMQAARSSCMCNLLQNNDLQCIVNAFLMSAAYTHMYICIVHLCVSKKFMCAPQTMQQKLVARDLRAVHTTTTTIKLHSPSPQQLDNDDGATSCHKAALSAPNFCCTPSLTLKTFHVDSLRQLLAESAKSSPHVQMWRRVSSLPHPNLSLSPQHPLTLAMYNVASWRGPKAMQAARSSCMCNLLQNNDLQCIVNAFLMSAAYTHMYICIVHLCVSKKFMCAPQTMQQKLVARDLRAVHTTTTTIKLHSPSPQQLDNDDGATSCHKAALSAPNFCCTPSLTLKTFHVDSLRQLLAESAKSSPHVQMWRRVCSLPHPNLSLSPQHPLPNAMPSPHCRGT